MQKLQLFLVILSLLAAFWPAASPLPGGAPLGSCQSMAPRHINTSPQEGPSPYSVIAKSYNNTVEVKIMGPPYKGILLEARYSGDTVAVGTWSTPPNDTKTIPCFSKANSAITHSNVNPKNNMTTYTWMGPCSKNNAVVFLATVASSKQEYWLKLTSGNVYLTCSGSVKTLHGYFVLAVLMISGLAVL
ncbi:putative defense protein 1 [Stegostoma tigrinum]|uniref:putative defense protein 1 n=1 Tax=Stegostoma tigrinum TaxID=3053191 RepID=UPI00202B76CF|nr:putative defense protein 1 [Stegostoma tigrinum]